MFEFRKAYEIKKGDGVYFVMLGDKQVKICETEEEANWLCDQLNQAWDVGFASGKYDT